MTLEDEALRRCERLFALMSASMEIERALGAGTVGPDATLRSMLRPILEGALARLEPMVSDVPQGSLQCWVRELIDLELDAAISQRGWRTLSVGLAPPPMLSDPA
jgi:hypothetical protein